MENEIKFVHREETFNDHAVDELADVRAMCICSLQFGRCEKSECKSCPHHRHFVACYSQMNDYDRTRLDSRIAARYSRYSHNAEGFMSYSRLRWYYSKYFIAALVCLLIVLLCAVSANAVEYKKYNPAHDNVKYKRFFSAQDIANAPEPRLKAKHKEVSDKTEAKVKMILSMTHRLVKDLDGDDWINCFDYAVTFKMLWDKHFDEMHCMIVRNTNPLVRMSHLFVSVWDIDNKDYVDVEPWTDNIDVWQMADNWGNLYDIYYNWYGEDYYWLGKVRKR